VAQCERREAPQAHLAIIDRGKVLDYLLNEAHADNGGKARLWIIDRGEDAPRLVTAYPGEE
jgi:hypothetical protein